MSDLIIVLYGSQSAAFAAGEALAVFQKEAGTEPGDIVVVTRAATGRVSVNQSIDLATGQPLGGGRWGALIGMLFLDRRKPGAQDKGLTAQFLEAGLEEAFLRAVGQSLDKGGAAVGMRVRLLGANRVLDRVKALKGDPKILHTRLSVDAEDALYDMQNQIPQDVLSQAADGLF